MLSLTLKSISVWMLSYMLILSLMHPYKPKSCVVKCIKELQANDSYPEKHAIYDTRSIAKYSISLCFKVPNVWEFRK